MLYTHLLDIMINLHEKNWNNPMILKLNTILPLGPFTNMVTLIPAYISNHMPCEVWDEITYPFLNFLHCWILGMDK